MTGTYDYNILLSVFYISYTLFEFPSNIACKWLGPAYLLPILTLGFGIASIGTAFVTNLPQICGVRFVLGLFESGVMPGIAYYLSRWYRRSELAFRLSLFIVMAPLAGAFGGLLASAILTLPSVGSLKTWRMIFIIEGIITVGLALISFLTLTDRPEVASWLTVEEKKLAIARVKSERIGQTELLDRMNGRKAWLGFWNPAVLANALISMLDNITVQGLAFFLPTIVASIYPSFTTVQKQLYTVPPYIVGAFFTVLLPALSWKFDRRQVFITLSAPLIMVGFAMFLASRNSSVRYAATFLVASSTFAIAPLCFAQVSVQVISDTSRSISLATNMMAGNLGGLIAMWSYISWDAPDFNIGNGLNLSSAGTFLAVSVVIHLWMLKDNRSRDKRDEEVELEGMSVEEIENLEWKHPAWRWNP
jgi:MFS family permease